MNSITGGNSWKHFGSPGRMYTDQGRAPLHRVNQSNPSSHNIPPMGEGGGLGKTIPRPGHEFSHRGEPLAKFWVAGADGHQSGSGAPAQGKPQQPVTAQWGRNVSSSPVVSGSYIASFFGGRGGVRYKGGGKKRDDDDDEDNNNNHDDEEDKEDREDEEEREYRSVRRSVY